jgi:hypothetical protein
MENLITQNNEWIEKLAIEEINMEESGIINYSNHLNPIHELEASSVAFMDQLKTEFEICVNKFNELRSLNDPSRLIKIFKISNTVNDFMLFRNGLKLVIARKGADVINIGFISNTGGIFAARMNYEAHSTQKLHEIKASVGPFNKIRWTFMGEPVEIDALVKHYLTEFIKHTLK